MIELDDLKKQAQVNSAVCQHAEEKLQQLQQNLFSAHTHIDQLQQQNIKLSSKVRHLKRRMNFYNRDLKKIILMS